MRMLLLCVPWVMVNALSSNRWTRTLSSSTAFHSSLRFYYKKSAILPHHSVPSLQALASENDDVTSTSSDSSGPMEEENNSSTEKVNDDTLTPGSSLADCIFGVAKTMLGTGILALPGGLAATSDFPSMLWPANILMLAMGALSGYTFSLYGRMAFRTKTKTLDSMWATIFRKENSNTKSIRKDNTSLPISVVSLIYCYGCCLTFLLVIADTLTSLTMLASPSGLPWWASRPSLIFTVSGGCLWPLCNLKSLQALAPVSIVGVLGCLVSTAFVVLRCPLVIKSSPYTAASAQFSTYNRVRGPAPLVLFSMGCVALMAHISAPAFLDSLMPKNADGTTADKNDRQTLRRFNLMTVLSYALVAALDAVCLTFGFLTFGGRSAGIVLNNYAPTDWGAALSRFLTAVSVGGSFPILFDAARSSALDMFGGTRRAWTTGLLTSLTAIAMLVKNAGFVVSFNGALMGTAILYIFPALMFLRLTAGEGRRRIERLFCRFLVGFGTVAALIGAATTVMNTYFPHLLIG